MVSPIDALGPSKQRRPTSRSKLVTALGLNLRCVLLLGMIVFQIRLVCK